MTPRRASLPHVTLTAAARERLRALDDAAPLAWGLCDAIAYVGNNRHLEVSPRRADCPVTLIAANRLIKLGHFMWLDDARTVVMLTYKGERAYAAIMGLPW